jgi:GTP-binding protein YchF
VAVSCGIIGLPAVGKTELFSLLTGKTTSGTEIETGSARIPDQRLDSLEEIYQPKKTTYALVDIVDIPGQRLTTGSEAAKNEREFLDAVQRVDALVHVVRSFANEAVWHVDGSIDPVRDLDAINTDLILFDLQLSETRLERIEAARKKGVKDNDVEYEVMKKCRGILEEEKPLSTGEFSEQELKSLQNIQFLTFKPLIIAVNLDDEQMTSGKYPKREETYKWAQEHGTQIFEINVKMEKEINELDPSEQELFLEEMGIKERGVAKLARAVYASMGLISFLTAGKDEVRAWTIKQGTCAKEAAGKIHSDIERGFIRAEVIAYDKFIECGSEKIAKEKGLYRLEGKDYIVKDGDIINFRFNV